MNGLAEGQARVLLIELRPEERQERFALLGDLGEGEVGEKRQALGLRQDPTDLDPRLIAKIQGSQDSQLDHSTTERTGAVTWQITPNRRTR